MSGRWILPGLLILIIVCSRVGLVAEEADSKQFPDVLPGTQPLTWEGDIASDLVDGVDRFLLGELEHSVERREPHWNRDFSSVDAYAESLEPNRERLSHILGVRDARQPIEALQLAATTSRPSLVGRGEGFSIYQVRWPALRDIRGEGLLLVPTGPVEDRVADVIVLPDADQTPEMLAGLAPGVPADSQVARHLAQSGCRVVIPALVSREMQKHIGRASLSNREFIYRSAFELGRHIIGYEIQKTLAVVDWYANQEATKPIGVFGYGEGGMLALYAAALDSRIEAVCVSGYFNQREGMWEEPISRNVFGRLEQFGDAELAAMIAPRTLIIEAARSPELQLSGDGGGAPAQLTTPELASVRTEFERARKILEPLSPAREAVQLVATEPEGRGPFASEEAEQSLLNALADKATVKRNAETVKSLQPIVEPAARQDRMIHEMDAHNQWLLVESPYVRAEFMEKLDTSSLETYRESVDWYRDFFRHEVVGHFDYPLQDGNVRTRKAYDKPAWVGYEVVMDVFPDVIAYGILLLPKDLQEGDRRPVVVCQHGLEGRPQEVVEGDHRAYHDFAAKLAERGYITFAPQNLYIFRDRFRTLQRKANPLKKTLFSVIVPQHQQIVNWLSSLPGVAPDRIGFYGLSYGGKSAMRIPPLVTDYALSICSADFNEWVWKNASSRATRYSYIGTGEYEIFEFDLGSTFNYSEMAALICPRPFMVERGHFDGVAPDETVAYEFAKVRFLYEARLGLENRCELEWFVGPHTINGQGTFEFLDKHLGMGAEGER